MSDQTPQTPDIKTIIADPDYQSLPDSEKAKVWAKLDPDFSSLDPSEQLKVLHATLTSAPTETRMSRLISGAAETGITGTLQGVANLPSMIMHPVKTATDIYAQQRAEFEKGKQAFAQGKGAEARMHLTAAAVPIVGPWMSQRAEDIQQDPWKGAGKVIGDVLPLVMGAGAEAGGEVLPRTVHPPMSGPIPGAAPTAMETGVGFIPAAGRMLAKSPIGSKPVSQAVIARNAAVMDEARSLLGPAPTNIQEIGTNAAVALRTAYKHTENVENALWNPFKADVEKAGVRVPLPATATAAEPEYLRGVESHEVLTSNLSKPTQQILTQIHHQQERAGAAKMLAESTNMGDSLGDFLSKLPPSERERVLGLIDQTPEPPPSFAAVKDARTEIGDLLDRAKRRDILGSNDATALTKIYNGLTQDLHDSLNPYPDLQKAFQTASAYTKAQKSLYGGAGTLTEDLMKPHPTVMPSETVNHLLRGTPESAANFVQAIGVNNPAARTQLASGVINKLVTDASGGTLNGILDGPKFATQFAKYRPVISKLVAPDMLNRWDAFAGEVKKYTLTKGSGGEGTWARISSLAEYGAATTAVGATLVGNIPVAAGAAAPLILGRQMVNLLLQPTGPNLFLRYLKSGKVSPALGKILAGTAYGASAGKLLPPPPSAER